MSYGKWASFLFIAVIALAAVVQANPGTITRSVSPQYINPNDIVTVTLAVDVNAGERYYVIEEKPPVGWEVTDAGELVKDNNGNLKKVQLENAADRTYTYTMKAPSTEGDYYFSGIYQTEGMADADSISGIKQVSISGPVAWASYLPAVIVVIALILIIAFYLQKRGKKAPLNKQK